MEKYKGFTIHILRDEDARSPREEMENFGTMHCAHRRYNLGDKQYRSRVGLMEGATDMTSDSLETLQNRLDRDFFWLPLYLYDHSGITMSTTPFNNPWDSGQVGIIAISKEKVRKEYNVKRISHKLKRKVLAVLRGEVNTYDQFLTGDVWGYRIEELDESCWGIYGEEECLIDAKYELDNYLKRHNATEYIPDEVGAD